MRENRLDPPVLKADEGPVRRWRTARQDPVPLVAHFIVFLLCLHRFEWTFISSSCLKTANTAICVKSAFSFLPPDGHTRAIRKFPAIIDIIFIHVHAAVPSTQAGHKPPAVGIVRKKEDFKYPEIAIISNGGGVEE
jgi:hypothetical protein